MADTKEQGLPEPAFRLTLQSEELLVACARIVRDCLDRDQPEDDPRPLELWIADSVLGYAALASDTGGRGVVEPFSDEDSLRQQAAAWVAVCRALDEASPGWHSLADRSMDSAVAALRAQPAGGGCETCDGKGYVVRYTDPYNRGDVSSPYDAPCGDCAPPESGGQGEAVAEVCRPGHPRPDSATFVRLLRDNTPDGTKLYAHPPAQAGELAAEYTRGRNDGWEAAEQKFRTQASGAVMEAKYHELLYAVGNKYPGESRHETALRYIRQAETQDSGPAQAALTQGGGNGR